MAVNLSPVGGVAAQFFTNTGAVLTGGKLYTYLAGTTTPATTFTSSQGGTPWTNPIVLDAAGRVPSGGEIWLTDGITYKFVLKDSTDVLIATYDNISGINSNAISFTNSQQIITATANQTVFNLSISYQPGTNSLSVFVDGVNQYGPGAQYAYIETDSDTVTFTNGLHVGAVVKFTTTQQQGAGAVNASQVTYDPAGTGAVATNVQAKLRQTVSVQDFGATGDGTTNDYTAILAAWTYCLANAKNLYFPAGTYNVGANNFPFRTPDTVSPITVLLDCKNITIFGDGPATILKTVSVSGADVLQLNAVQNLTIRDLQVTATISGSVSGSNGISITNGFDNLNLLDIYCYRLPSLDKGSGNIDGGGALSIQTPSTGQVTACGSLIAKIRAEGCYYGFLANGQFDVLQTIGNRQGVVVDLLAENCCIGYFAGYTVDATYPAIGSTSGITVRATTINCQVDVFAPIQAVGDDITVSVVTSKSKAARLLNPNGVRWDASTVTINDTLYAPGQLCVAGIIERAHNCTIQITGDKGACDYKAAIGASATASNSATQYSFIYLDIGGTASTANVVELTSTGGCLNYSTLNITFNTATTANLRADAPSFFIASRYNQIISGSQTYATEGTWTPVLADSGLIDKGATYTTQQGNYVVTGGWLHFNAYLSVTGLGTLTTSSAAFIIGLPFVNTALDISSLSVGYSSGMSMAAANIPCARVESSEQYIRLGAFRNGPNVTAMLVSEFSATGVIALSGSYKVTL